MEKPILSEHFISRKPSPIRSAQIEFMKRTDGVEAERHPRAKQPRGFTRNFGSFQQIRGGSSTYSNTPDFETTTGPTFKGVEVALVTLCFYSEQIHFYVAFRAEKQRLDWFFRGGLWERTNVSHAMHPCWLVALLHARKSYEHDVIAVRRSRPGSKSSSTSLSLAVG